MKYGGISSEPDLQAALYQARDANHNAAPPIDDERVVGEVLHREEDRRRVAFQLADAVIDRRIPDRVSRNQPALAVGRNRDRVQIVAELLAGVDGLDERVEAARVRIAERRRGQMLRRVDQPVARYADCAEAADVAKARPAIFRDADVG